MSTPWSDDAPLPETKRHGLLGLMRITLRGVALATVTYIGLLILLILRAIERPIFRLKRPITPFITQVVCRLALIILGIRLIRRGNPMPQKGAVVSNHVAWLDIFALNAAQRIYFVSKAEVSGWPAIGWLARATGTVFIERKGTQALEQKNLFEERLQAGHKLLFFPEGTSTDGKRVLPFKSTLFAAFFSEGLKDILWIQPTTLIYRAPNGEDPRFYGWWGNMDFGPHLLKILAAPRHGSIEVVFHQPVKVTDFPNRKALTAYCEKVIRDSLTSGIKG